MASVASISDHRAYHILSYGTLLGSTIFQSFIGGVVAYKVLPRAQFSTLQQATFPVFFSMQTVLPVLLAVTYPGAKVIQVAGEVARSQGGFGGVLADSNRWTVLAPLATLLLTSALNLLLVGPATTKAMKDRHRQGEHDVKRHALQALTSAAETKDGKKSYDAGPHSDDMQKLNTLFGTLHSISTILNLAGLYSTIFYGFVLAERL